VQLPSALVTWLQDSINGGVDILRDLTVYQVDFDGQSRSRMEIENAFLREFRISALDTADNKSPIQFSFVAVPGQIQLQSWSQQFPFSGRPPTLSSANFTLTIDNIDASRMRGLSALRMSWPKVMQENEFDIRRIFAPGLPSTDNVTVSFSPTGGSTASQMDMWLAEVALGNALPRNATLQLRDATLAQVVHTVAITGLWPLQSLPFPTGAGLNSVGNRTALIRVGSFTIQ
jgi:hypothetical protein